MLVCSPVAAVTEFGGAKCSSYKAYLSVVCANGARASKGTIRVALMLIWVAKVSHFVIPRLYVKCWGSIPVRRKKLKVTKKLKKI